MSKVIVIYGLPCAGKTTICNFLIDKFLAAHVYTDEVWKDVFPDPKYTSDESHAVFAKVLSIVQQRINQKTPAIIVEGVFASIERLRTLKSLVIATNYEFYSVLLFASSDILKTRNHNRKRLEETDMKDDVIDWLKSKFNSQEFCDISINTGIISEEVTTFITAQLVQNGR